MYKHLKVPELKQLCKEKGIKGYSKKKKEELLAMLNKTEAGAVITHHIAKTDPENLEGEKAEIKVKDESSPAGAGLYSVESKKKQQLSTSSRPYQGEGREPQGRNSTLSSQPRRLKNCSSSQSLDGSGSQGQTQNAQNIFKPKKNYFINIHTSFNNTLINVTNFKGDTIAWASGGSIGPKNVRKKGSFAARQVGYALGKKCRKKKIKHVQVKVKGLGYCKKHAIRGIKSSGIKIKEIHEITGIPYNGCRLQKKKR